MDILNLVLLFVISLGIIIFLCFRIKKHNNSLLTEDNNHQFDIETLIDEVRVRFNEIIRTNVSELNLNKEETLKSQRNKDKLRTSYKNCCYGNLGSKAYVKDYIKKILQEKLGINEFTINETIKFEQDNKLSIQDKFEILLYLYKKEYRFLALSKLISENNLAVAQESYTVSEKDIELIYKQRQCNTLDYQDKLEVLSQRIYQRLKGLGVIDEIRDQKIDGVSVGVSGMPVGFYDYDNILDSISYSYDSVWIFFQGKTIHLDFLGFGSQRELERVCKNIYRFNNPGQLSMSKGYITNEMSDGSRIVVTRPPFSESWAFFVRKFDSIMVASMDEVIKDKNKDLAIKVMEYIVRGNQVTAITGTQGCGKTTLLKALIEFINSKYTIRVQEMSFELWLRKIYPKRNILTFRETATISGQEGLDLQKKTDGTVNILGEVSTAPVSSWLIQISQVASLFTLFTHHAKTTKQLIFSMRNALLQEGGFSNEKIAEEQVVDAIRFDIHMEKTVDGHRYIERITEIIPGTYETYSIKDIIVYKGGEYCFNAPISDSIQKEIRKVLSEEQIKEFELCMRGEIQ